jgi:hypothetical protein
MLGRSAWGGGQPASTPAAGDRRCDPSDLPAITGIIHYFSTVSTVIVGWSLVGCAWPEGSAGGGYVRWLVQRLTRQLVCLLVLALIGEHLGPLTERLLEMDPRAVLAQHAGGLLVGVQG